MKISLAPLQGYTDWVFRRAYKKYIGGIDEFYTPFLVLQNDDNLKKSHEREVEDFSREGETLVPQFLCGTNREMQFFQDYFSGLGYPKMNWNLGCPYPMVTKRNKGSGLLPFADKIGDILQDWDSDKIDLSVKMRLGLEDEEEIDKILPIFQKMGVGEVIVHPRIGKQLYKGSVRIEKFNQLFSQYGELLAYNGDIQSKADVDRLIHGNDKLLHIMIGRGVLMDYWLPQKIKDSEIPEIGERKELLKRMHDEIFQNYATYLNGDAQILNKMKPFWEYFSWHFENQRKVYKQIKKAAGINKYNAAVDFAFCQNLK